MTFENKVALVTGAAKGIGLATARRFAEMGATVVLSDIDEAVGNQVTDELRANGFDVRFIATDVADPEAVANLFSQIKEDFGKLHFAFNNAGVEGHIEPFNESTISEWDRIIGVNLSGVYYCMRHEIPLMRAAGEGVIINCSSIAGLVGVPHSAIYCASKHGVVGLTRSVALELATDGIRVNAVCPGAIETEMVTRVFEERPETRQMVEASQPIKRLGTPDEVAGAVIWLCLDESALLTGVALPLDGGWTAR